MAGQPVRPPRRLAEATWREVADWDRPLLLVPLGSTEQHGPHLALSTDTVIAEELCRRMAVERARLVIAPALAIGASGEHAGFAGTLSIGTTALASVVSEVVRSARGSFAGVVVVNGHGGNGEALAIAAHTAEDDGDALLVLHPTFPGGDAHAGRTETSLLLALDASLVRKDEVMAGNTTPLSQIATELRSRGVAAVSPTGVLGDPTGASAAEGAALLSGATASLLTRLDDWCGR